MDFQDYVFQGLTIMIALVGTFMSLKGAETVRAKREYKKRLKKAQEFSKALREQLGDAGFLGDKFLDVEGDTQDASGDRHAPSITSNA